MDCPVISLYSRNIHYKNVSAKSANQELSYLPTKLVLANSGALDAQPPATKSG